ncbi:uncharacterized protein LOC133917866 [Phragmites australis]|uniref:uncharacterized protein LOC133917866 n=1 Tax=Phragmites australis TaxID=29695 RepID=UPI002D775EC5|nr:uncharacterized protein LOC133917866 [Phragmites australis]
MRRRNIVKQILMDSSSTSSDDDELIVATAFQVHDEDQRLNVRRHGGSVPGHRVIHRGREAGHARLYQDYFSEDPTYGPAIFRRRFRMARSLFLRIVQSVVEHDSYFMQKRNSAGILGLSPLQKITAAFRMLAYGVPADATDEFIRIGESTAIESLKRFVQAVVEVFSDEYLRSPNNIDTARLLEMGEARGFRAEGQAPEVNYTINGHNYTMGYYLADGIYPPWATFMKTITSPQGNKKKLFSQAQEGVRKDVERVFGVLQARFAIVRGPARFWDQETLGQIMTACVIMHNMIIEYEREDFDYDHEPKNFHYDHEGERVIIEDEHTPELSQFMEFIKNNHDIRDRQAHSQLQDDLVEHLWQLYTES